MKRKKRKLPSRRRTIEEVWMLRSGEVQFVTYGICGCCPYALNVWWGTRSGQGGFYGDAWPGTETAMRRRRGQVRLTRHVNLRD